MRFDLVTLFPDFFESPLRSGLVGKALQKQIAEVFVTNPRDFTQDKHRKVDDEPYGGGVGMVMKPEPIAAALDSLPQRDRRQVIYFTPQGAPMTQSLFKDLATNYDQLVLLCGHYEGVDERVMSLVDREVSLGDFVLTCGEIPALTLLNGVLRLRPGTVGKEESLKAESFEEPLLDYPHYTRPPEFRGMGVPPVLLSGNHPAIAHWRREEQILRTRDRRPDLYQPIPDRPTYPTFATPDQWRVVQQVVNQLETHHIRYQITGGLAGNFYGSTWPLQDFDLDIASADLDRAYQLFEPWAIAPPDRYVDHEFELILLQLKIDGLVVEMAADTPAYALRGKKRISLKTDLSTAHRARCLGLPLWVQSLKSLIDYKKILGRSADVADLRQLL